MMEDSSSVSRHKVERDDTVIFVNRSGKPKLGLVSRIFRGIVQENETSEQKLKEGEILIEACPGRNNLIRKETEVHVVDRGFALSETVTRINDPKRIGFVKKIYVTADCLVLPQRKIVARNVGLARAKFVEPFPPSGQSYLLYNDWIGSAKKCVFELSVVYKNSYRCTIKDNVSAAILYRRRDCGHAKQWVPGEVVMISTSYVISKKVKWETELPAHLRKRLMKGTHSNYCPFTIEKVSLYSVRVRWIMTPSASVTPPPEKIVMPETEKVIKLDTLDYTQAVCGDRMRLFPDDSVTVIRKTEWDRKLSKELLAMVPEEVEIAMRKRWQKAPSSSSSSCSGSSNVSIKSSPAKKRQAVSVSDGASNTWSNCINTSIEDSKAAPKNGEVLMANVPESSQLQLKTSESAQMKGSSEVICQTGNGDKQTIVSRDVSSCIENKDKDKKLISEVESFTAVPAPISPIVSARLSLIKKNKIPFSLRQARRIKASRPLKRKVEPIPAPLDMRQCLGNEFYGEIVHTRTVVDVLWMNGVTECFIRASDLVPYELDLDQHDHTPSAVVVKKISEELEAEFGIVLSTDPEQRLADVQWFKYDWKTNGAEPVMTEKELCSLFELMLHPNYHRFFWGSLCLRTSYESTDVRDLVGQVISSNPNGKNTVAFFNGNVEELWPVEITNLLTTEELDDGVDDDDEDMEWEFSDDNDDEENDDEDDGEPEESEKNMDAGEEFSGSSVAIVFNGEIPSAHSDFDARVFVPKGFISAARRAVEFEQNIISRLAPCKPSKSWLKTHRNKEISLLELTQMIENLRNECRFGSDESDSPSNLSHDEIQHRMRFFLKSFADFPKGYSHFSFDDFFFTCVAVVDKDETKIEWTDRDNDIALRHLKISFDIALEALNEINNKYGHCTVVLSFADDKSMHTSEDTQFMTARLNFLDYLFRKAMKSVFSFICSICRLNSPLVAQEIGPSSSAEDDITSVSSITEHQLPEFIKNQAAYISEDFKQAVEETANVTSFSPINIVERLTNRSALPDTFDNTKVEEMIINSLIKLISTETTKMGETMIPSLMQSSDLIERSFIEEKMMRINSYLVSDIRAVNNDFDQNVDAVLKVKSGSSQSTATKSLIVKDNEIEMGTSECTAETANDENFDGDNPLVLPAQLLFPENTTPSQKLASSVAASLATMTLALLNGSFIGADLAQIFSPLMDLDSHHRNLFMAVNNQRKEKDGNAVTCSITVDQLVVIDALTEYWYNVSLRCAKLLRTRLMHCMSELMIRVRVACSAVLKAAMTKNSDPNQIQQSTETENKNSEEMRSSSASPMELLEVESAPSSAIDSRRFPALELDDKVPSSHAFISKAPTTMRSFMKTVRSEHSLLSKHLPEGIYVKAFEERLDLLSAVIIGPAGTPYEDVPFFFDIHLPHLYPAEPPLVHYWAYSQEQLNPNLYQVGKVCTSLLGTWNGKGTEQWTPDSNLLQVFISIQGLVLVAEPYYNEAGYEARKTFAESAERSRRYNEMALINSLDYFYRINHNPPKGFEKLIQDHCQQVLPSKKARIRAWESGESVPPFPLFPISEGCKLSLRKISIILSTVSDEKIDGMSSSSS